MSNETPNEALEARIRERAYQLWIEEGQPHGRADDHWHEAARRVSAEESGRVGLDDVDQLAADPAAAAVRASAAKG